MGLALHFGAHGLAYVTLVLQNKVNAGCDC